MHLFLFRGFVDLLCCKVTLYENTDGRKRNLSTVGVLWTNLIPVPALDFVPVVVFFTHNMGDFGRIGWDHILGIPLNLFAIGVNGEVT